LTFGPRLGTLSSRIDPGQARILRFDVLAQQRQQRILEEVERLGGARVGDLVELLHVSDITVRRDLDALAHRGLLTKVHGGATAMRTDDGSPTSKFSPDRPDTLTIPRLAAGLVAPGTAIGLAAGTPTWELAAQLLDVPGLTVVTNSVPVAEVFYASAREDQTVILTGGIRSTDHALVGPVAVQTLRSLHLDQLFLAVHGMDEVRGYTSPSLTEAETNRALIDAARELVVLADHTKWGVIGLSTFADIDEAEVVVSDDLLAEDAQQFLNGQVSRLLLADAG
jgi:DeoR/GlpR family transcriptional regulator of sugar metabolism